MKKLVLFFVVVLLSGCHPIGSFCKGEIIKEQPFATTTLDRSPAEAALCIGEYWQSQNGTDEIGDGWQVWTYPNEVEVARPIHLAPHPLITAVVTFGKKGGKTIATAYCHPAFSEADRAETTVTLRALDACKGLEPAKVVEAVKIEPKFNQPTITKKPKYQEIINQ